MNNPINLKAIVEALHMVNDETSAFYNTETGAIAHYSEYDSHDDTDPEEYEDEKYIALPTQRDIGEYDMMERFTDTVQDEHKRELLEVALEGRGAFRRFKDTLIRVDLQTEWYAFKDEAYVEVAREWCERNGLKYEDDGE